MGSGDLVCGWCWTWNSGGSALAFGPSIFRHGGMLGAFSLGKVRASLMFWRGEVSCRCKIGELSRGGAEECAWGSAGRMAPSGFGIWGGSCWGADTDSSRGRCCSVGFGLVTAASWGGVCSTGFVLLRVTLEQVCRWVSRPRYERNLVRQLSHLQKEKPDDCKHVYSSLTAHQHIRRTQANSLEENVGFVMMPHVLHQFLHVGERTTAADSRAQQHFT